MEHITLIVILNLKINTEVKFMWLYWFVHTCESTITLDGAGADDNTKQADERNKGVIFKTFAPFTNCISEIINT